MTETVQWIVVHYMRYYCYDSNCCTAPYNRKFSLYKICHKRKNHVMCWACYQVLYIGHGTFLWKLGIAVLSVSNSSLWLLYTTPLFGTSFTNFTYKWMCIIFFIETKMEGAGFLWLKSLLFIVEINSFQGFHALVSTSLKSPAQICSLMTDELWKTYGIVGKICSYSECANKLPQSVFPAM
jgi:hypothetical protein